MRSDHVFSPHDYICLHHEQLYINKYSNWQLKCCDPWQLHKKTISYKYLKALSEIEAKAINTLLKLSGKFFIKPGQKLCYDCFNACDSSQSSELSEQNRDDVDVGSRGSHSVCVCKTLTDKLTYHDLLEVLVCNTESKSCMLHRCKNCPGISALQLHRKQARGNYAREG